MRAFQLIALSVIVTALVAACGGGGDDDDAAIESPITDTTTAGGEQATSETTAAPTEAVVWEWNGASWQAMGDAPECPEPVALALPADLTLATHALYPGQVRGGDFKPHGGLRFDGTANDRVTVTMPLDATLVRGSRYIEQGEVQYLFDFVHSCGLMIRLDHLHTLTPQFQAYADQLPEPQVDDSRTNPLPNDLITAGTEIATAVGFVESANSAFDLGVYDLRAQNPAWQDPAFASAHADEMEQAAYAVCWFDLLEGEHAAHVRSLPPGDPTSGTDSAYC